MGRSASLATRATFASDSELSTSTCRGFWGDGIFSGSVGGAAFIDGYLYWSGGGALYRLREGATASEKVASREISNNLVFDEELPSEHPPRCSVARPWGSQCSGSTKPCRRQMGFLLG